MTGREMEEILNDLAMSTRNNALDAAARVARLYGAPEEACRRILMLKGDPTPMTEEKFDDLNKRST